MNQFTNKSYNMFLYFLRFATRLGKISSLNNFGRTFSLPALLVILLAMVPGHLLCQDSTEVIPDGTQGETITISKHDTVLTLGNWNEFDGTFSTLKLGGGFLYEYGTYIQDDVSKEQIDMEPAFRVRDFRITMSGRVKVKRFITWKLGIMYDAPSNSWLIRETGIMVGVPEYQAIFLSAVQRKDFL